jgi:hypothetical protein
MGNILSSCNDHSGKEKLESVRGSKTENEKSNSRFSNNLSTAHKNTILKPSSFHMVNEQNKPLPHLLPKPTTAKTIAGYYGSKYDKVVYANSSKPIISGRINGFYDAFYNAYFRHLNLVLSADQFWLIILQSLSIQINQNSEKFRHKFVNFGEKMDLDVRYMKLESDQEYEDLISGFNDKLKKEVNPELFELLQPNFSTLTPIMKTVTSITVMNVCSKFFHYKGHPLCGIRSVRLLGTLEDWEKLRKKAEILLNMFEMDWWSPYLLPILDELVLIYKGKSNTLFWDTSYRTLPTDRIRSYKNLGIYYPMDGITDRLSGWIFNLSPFVQDDYKLERNSEMKTLETFYDLHNHWFRMSKEEQVALKLDTFDKSDHPYAIPDELKTKYYLLQADTDSLKRKDKDEQPGLFSLDNYDDREWVDLLKHWEKAYGRSFYAERFVKGMTETEITLNGQPRILVSGFIGCDFTPETNEITPAVSWFLIEKGYKNRS